MLLLALLTFPLVTFGLAWPLAARLTLDPAEKIVASVMLSLLGAYLLAFAIYGLGFPAAAWILIPALGIGGLILGRSTLVTTVRDPDARSLLVGYGLIAAWSVGWLALVASYSGGGWVGDWFEHWERSRFFTERWPLETKLLGYAPLPARPPLANLVTGACLVFGGSFAGYQMVTALLNGLIFLPAALLARRFGGRAAIAGFVVLLMVNPLFVQNSTFAWTKLIAGCFVLGGLHFFLRAREPAPPLSAAPLCALCLAAGILVHYSAGPYAVLLVVAWLLFEPAQWRQVRFWKQTLLMGLLGGLILATWFGWSFAHYGVATTLFSNSSVDVPEARQGNQLLKIALNLRDTIVPHFLRTMDPDFIAQRSSWSYVRDWFFQLYQVNLLFACGCMAWLAVLASLARDARTAVGSVRFFWIWFVGGGVTLGVAVHGARDHWGLTHICLQSLVILGLAYLAARWRTLGRGWQLALLAGAAVDLALGIALQFAAESQTPDLALALGRSPPGTTPIYNANAVMNLMGKLVHGLDFFRDAVAAPVPLVLIWLAVILALALRRLRPASN